MKNVLIPTDFSDNAWNAVSYAVSFFKKERCNFYILHVCRPNAMVGGDIAYTPNTRIVQRTVLSDAETKMNELVERAEALSGNSKHNYISLIDYNYLIDSIKEFVREKEINLIVMGTKGASGLREVVIGSNTGDVITRVPCPELVIPEDAVFESPAQIVFPTDFNLLYNADILDTLVHICNMHNAHIHVLFVTKNKEKLNAEQVANRELLLGYLSDCPCTFHTTTNNRLENAIQDFVKTHDVDMIAMVAKNLNFFQQIFFRPTVENISYHTKVPFLVLHEKSIQHNHKKL
ncbi:universal stress protein [Ascidiimonas aurantiaca]|uniref:universal stress protein n=1 Tax=Ascidiimonas aurantiaca TaxID=1685432 RepID=UPI0030EF17D8